jgi:hypothetical protein
LYRIFSSKAWYSLIAALRALRLMRRMALRNGRPTPVAFLNAAPIASKIADDRISNTQCISTVQYYEVLKNMLDILKDFFTDEEWEIKEEDGQTMAYLESGHIGGPVDINLSDLARYIESKAK